MTFKGSALPMRPTRPVRLLRESAGRRRLETLRLIRPESDFFSQVQHEVALITRQIIMNTGKIDTSHKNDLLFSR